MELDRRQHPPIGSGGSNLGQTVGYKPSEAEIAEAKAQQERGLDLTIRQHALTAALNFASIGSGGFVKDGSDLAKTAELCYSFLKGNN